MSLLLAVQGGGPAGQTLTATLFTNSNAFYAHTATPGAVTLTAGLFSSGTNAFYAASLSQGGGAQTLTQAARFDNAQAFYGPAVSPGAVTLVPGLLSNAQAFYSATVTQGGAAQTLTPALVSNPNTFYTATVSAGAVTLAPVRLDNSNTFYAPSVTRGSVTLTPGLFTNPNTFFGGDVDAGVYILTTAQAQRLYQIYLLHGLKAGSPLSVSDTQRVAGGLVQAVTEGGGSVTIATTGTPTGTGLDVGAMVDELAALHGLTVNLVVTATTRAAGAVSQTLALAGAVTTVTRL